MNIDEYFSLSTSPSPKSPIALLMRRILVESPELSFEHARAAAHRQMQKAAAKKHFRVTTPKQDERAAERLAGRRKGETTV